MLKKSTKHQNIEMDTPGYDIDDNQLSNLYRQDVKTRRVDKLLAFFVTFSPPVGVLVALYLAATGWYQISAFEISLLVVTHIIAVAGVELGFHRYCAHRSFEASKWTKIVLLAMGSTAVQGPAIWWSAVHRKHHKYSDRPNDPHSIYIAPSGTTEYRSGFWQHLFGFIHSHVGWIWTAQSIRFSGWTHYVNDLYRDKEILFIHVNYLYFLAAGFVIPALAGATYYGISHNETQIVKGFIVGFLWGGLVRVFTVNHLFYWSINTLSHSIGSRPFKTKDKSTNSIPLIFALPTFGQSYHNNHHAFPRSPKMSYTWWEFDIGYACLWLLSRAGCVELRSTPTQLQIKHKKTRTFRNAHQR
ncbi:acyl-CoA desaturase [Veronia nyctiphanis]|uniref:Acyl-CoA desaturase n=1 Tax=Veronia nyctiphanis TaxID=1278244 RepID=A0A4Q0YS24_9GAMM|nr:fatty acid desaturase [Veronia nyctiphanis]RXJ71751.1 acyl-CoA desaturase [Veronia nyctiphanis]